MAAQPVPHAPAGRVTHDGRSSDSRDLLRAGIASGSMGVSAHRLDGGAVLAARHADRGPTLPRRAVLRATGVLGAAAAGATLLGGCARGAGKAPPSAGHGVLEVPFALWVVAIPINPATTRLIQEFVDTAFNAKHKGLRAVWQPQPNLSALAATITAGGPAPAVVAGCCTGWPSFQPFAKDLDAQLRQQNVNLDLWSPAALAAGRLGATGALQRLPANSAIEAYLYRQDILDSLGLTYPAADWTYQDAARLWQACTGTQSGQHRYGTTVPWGNTGVPEGLSSVLHGFGGAYASPDGARCLLDAPNSIRCGEFFFDLVWSGVGTTGDGSPNPGVFDGSVVFTQGAVPTILEAVQRLGSTAKWDFIGYPRWPVRPATILHDAFYAINAFAPRQDIAWEILNFVAIGTQWQDFSTRLTLSPPPQLPLLSKWVAALHSIAPILKTKSLHYWVDPTLHGEAYSQYEFFRYSPLQANTLVANVWPSLWKRQLGVSAAFHTLTQQINALEVAGAHQPPTPTAAQRITQVQGERRRFPVRGPGVAAVPPGR